MVSTHDGRRAARLNLAAGVGITAMGGNGLAPAVSVEGLESRRFLSASADGAGFDLHGDADAATTVSEDYSKDRGGGGGVAEGRSGRRSAGGAGHDHRHTAAADDESGGRREVGSSALREQPVHESHHTRHAWSPAGSSGGGTGPGGPGRHNSLTIDVRRRTTRYGGGQSGGGAGLSGGTGAQRGPKPSFVAGPPVMNPAQQPLPEPAVVLPPRVVTVVVVPAMPGPVSSPVATLAATPQSQPTAPVTNPSPANSGRQPAREQSGPATSPSPRSPTPAPDAEATADVAPDADAPAETSGLDLQDVRQVFGAVQIAGRDEGDVGAISPVTSDDGPHSQAIDALPAAGVAAAGSAAMTPATGGAAVGGTVTSFGQVGGRPLASANGALVSAVRSVGSAFGLAQRRTDAAAEDSTFGSGAVIGGAYLFPGAKSLGLAGADGEGEGLAGRSWVWEITAGVSLAAVVVGYWYCNNVAVRQRALNRGQTMIWPGPLFVLHGDDEWRR